MHIIDMDHIILEIYKCHRIPCTDVLNKECIICDTSDLLLEKWQSADKKKLFIDISVTDRYPNYEAFTKAIVAEWNGNELSTVKKKNASSSNFCEHFASVKVLQF